MPAAIRSFILLGLIPCMAATASHATETDTRGAQLYRVECAICHEKLTTSIGLIGKLRAQFPATQNRTEQLLNHLANKLDHGGPVGSLAAYLPSWMMTINSEDGKALISTLQQAVENDYTEPRLTLTSLPVELMEELGYLSFRVRCSRCHGFTGLGNGHLAKIIKEPSPVNLTKSNRSLDYIRRIITDGGASMDRSPVMPAWKQELYAEEIEALTSFVFNLRSTSIVPDRDTDGIFIIANAALDIESITLNQASDLWLGRSQGLNIEQSFKLADQSKSSEIRSNFYTAVSRKTLEQIEAHWAKLVYSGKYAPPKILIGDNAVTDWVSRTPASLGYVSTLTGHSGVKVLLELK